MEAFPVATVARNCLFGGQSNNSVKHPETILSKNLIDKLEWAEPHPAMNEAYAYFTKKASINTDHQLF